MHKGAPLPGGRVPAAGRTHIWRTLTPCCHAVTHIRLGTQCLWTMRVHTGVKGITSKDATRKTHTPLATMLPTVLLAVIDGHLLTAK